MADLQYILLAVFPVVVAGLYFMLYRWRYSKFAYVPSNLKSNLFIGHLGLIGAEYKRVGDSKVHPDIILENILKSQGSPDFLFLDTRPAERPLVVIASNDLAEQVSRSTKQRPYSTTKSPTVQGGLGKLIGPYSLFSEEGESWKALRKRFNPGFAPQHLLSLLPVVLDKTATFVERLDALAASEVATAIEPYTTNVTFDIIGEVVTNIDCKAQDEKVQGDGIVKNFKMLGKTYANDNGLAFTWANIPLQIRRHIYSGRLEKAVKSCIQEKFNTLKAGGSLLEDRSVLALAIKDVDVMTPRILQSISDQVKSFLFAGHDTTSILLQRLFYALSIHPQCLAKIRAEHDDVFGSKDPREAFLAAPDDTMKALVYTSACIKEALRLWPPAGSARMSHDGVKLHTSSGEDVCLDKCVIYLCHHIIHRDPKVYGETANDFIPERWVGDSSTSATVDENGSATGPSKIPASSWRPFERGPRNCIGQELANIEARVILACTLRRYDFVKVGVGAVETDEKGLPMIDEKGKYKTKSEVISTMSITAKPIDGMVMRVKMREVAP